MDKIKIDPTQCEMASLLENNFFDSLNFSQDVKNTINTALVELGAEEIGDVQYITDKDLIDKGVKVIPARKLIIHFNKYFSKTPGPLRRTLGVSIFPIIRNIIDNCIQILFIFFPIILKIDRITRIVATHMHNITKKYALFDKFRK